MSDNAPATMTDLELSYAIRNELVQEGGHSVRQHYSAPPVTVRLMEWLSERHYRIVIQKMEDGCYFVVASTDEELINPSPRATAPTLHRAIAELALKVARKKNKQEIAP